MTKILLLNTGFSNKGSLALVISTVDTINKYIPNVDFAFMGVETKQNKIPIKKQLALKPLKNLRPWVYLLNCSFFYLSKKLGMNPSISQKSKLYDYYKADVVINSGGDHLSGEKFGLSTFLNISYAILLDKPVVLYAESLGYYQNSIFNFIAKTIFNHVELITVREDLSKKYLDFLNLTNPKIYLTADSAFNLSSASESRVLEILSNEKIVNFARPLVGINASGLISRYIKNGTKSEEQQIIDIFAKVIDSIVKKLNATVILVPHVYTENRSDVKVLNAIYDTLSDTSNVFKLNNEYSPKELKGIIGMCDLFIGARMHSTIASTSMLVPTVGIAYSHKMNGIIGGMLGLEKYIIDINNLTYEKLMEMVDEAWLYKDDIKEMLASKIPEIQEKEAFNGILIKELVESF